MPSTSSPLKPVVLHWTDLHGSARQLQGECVVTATGIEGSAIYAIAADLRDAILVGCKTTMWRADGADMQGALTDNKSSCESVEKMPAAEMLREHARWCETGGAEGQPSVFNGVDLRPLKSITGLNLTALSAKGAVFYGLDMEGVQLQGAQLEGADLRSALMSRIENLSVESAE